MKIARQPIPFRGPSNARIAVIGEAPGKLEDATGEVFVGPSGQLINGLLVDTGFAPEELAWLNTVSCFPNRTPTEREVEICSGNVDRQLQHISPDYIIALGGIAVGRWWKDIRMGDIRGRFWQITFPVSAWVIATWHPAAILRNHTLHADTERDLRKLRRVISTGGRDPLGLDRGAFPYPFEGNCVICGDFGDHWLAARGADGESKECMDGPDGRGGLAFCEKHWSRRIGTGGTGRTPPPAKRASARKERKPTDQEGMF